MICYTPTPVISLRSAKRCTRKHCDFFKPFTILAPQGGLLGPEFTNLGRWCVARHFLPSCHISCRSENTCTWYLLPNFVDFVDVVTHTYKENSTGKQYVSAYHVATIKRWSQTYKAIANCKNCDICVCASMRTNYNTNTWRTVLIIFPFILQTVIIARTLSTWRTGVAALNTIIILLITYLATSQVLTTKVSKVAKLVIVVIWPGVSWR